MAPRLQGGVGSAGGVLEGRHSGLFAAPSMQDVMLEERWHKDRTDGSICSKMIPMSEPLETVELLAFTRVVEARSFSRGAAELGVPRATIGRRLARLEERLGTRLLRRTTRSLAL